MVLGITAYSLFAIHDAFVKGVIAELPAVQILFVRSLVVAAICLAVGRRPLVKELLTSPHKPMLLVRAVVMLAAFVLFYSTARDLGLAEMTTLYYFAPILTIVLAVIFLRERPTPTRICAAAIGFFGVIVATNPVGLTIGVPALMVIGAAACWSIAMILMRNISKSESSLVQIFSLNLFFVVAMGLASIWLWQPMGPREIAFAVAAGVVGGMAQYVLVEAARLIPASVLGTVEYGALIWSFVFGFLFWGEQPEGFVYWGAALIVAAGLLLAWSEQRSRRRVVSEAP